LHISRLKWIFINCVCIFSFEGNSIDPNRVNVTDRKDNGWLGGALLENSDSFIACSSRWSNQFYENVLPAKGHYYMNGMCNWRPKNDIFQDNLPQISSKVSRLLPLTTESDTGINYACQKN
jgi:hypothetical protein